MSTIVGKIWPNGEFGYSTTRRTDSGFDRPIEKTEDELWKVRALEVHGLHENVRAFAPSGKTAEFLSMGDKAKEVAPFGLSNLTKSHKSARGGKGLTSYGGKMLRNGVYLMEEKYGKSRLSFLTLTLPDLRDEDWGIVVKNWGEILRVFFQWLRRKQEAASLETVFVSCTEVQPKRYESTGKPALHVHCVFLGRRQKRGWIVTPIQVRKAWKRSVSRFLTNSSNTYSWNAVENLQRVKRSAGAYLSKYLSKGRRGLQLVKSTSNPVPLPSSWWNSSLSLKRLITKLRIPICGTVGEWLIILSPTLHRDWLVYIRDVKVKKFLPGLGTLDTGGMTVGAYGALTREGVMVARAVLKASL